MTFFPCCSCPMPRVLNKGFDCAHVVVPSVIDPCSISIFINIQFKGSMNNLAPCTLSRTYMSCMMLKSNPLFLVMLVVFFSTFLSSKSHPCHRMIHYPMHTHIVPLDSYEESFIMVSRPLGLFLLPYVDTLQTLLVPELIILPYRKCIWCMSVLVKG